MHGSTCLQLIHCCCSNYTVLALVRGSYEFVRLFGWQIQMHGNNVDDGAPDASYPNAAALLLIQLWQQCICWCVSCCKYLTWRALGLQCCICYLDMGCKEMQSSTW
jgi:hypothetical protein